MVGKPQVSNLGQFFFYIRSTLYTCPMLIIPLQIAANDCIDCVKQGVDGDWGQAIACVVTLAITAVIRHFEKKRIEKKMKKDQ